MNLDHKNIVKLIDKKISDNNIYLIMEYCKGGNLAKIIENYGNKETIKLEEMKRFLEYTLK